MSEEKAIKSYKGFNKDMKCRGFQYEEGKDYETDRRAEACKTGFHACEYPLDCFGYYAPASSEFHVVHRLPLVIMVHRLPLVHVVHPWLRAIGAFLMPEMRPPLLLHGALNLPQKALRAQHLSFLNGSMTMINMF